MAKDPAFLFYTKDFLSGIQDLTMEERGQYITLLCLQHQKGHLSEKAIRLCVGNAAADVLAKFRQDPAGLWYNVRLEQEIEKRSAHGEKQKQRAIDGWKKRKNQTNESIHQTSGIQSGNAAALPLVNGDANVNGSVNEKGVKGEKSFLQSDIDGDTIVFPIPGPAMIELWAEWKKHRWKNYGVIYKMQGEQAALNQLSGMKWPAIKETINQAIAANWKNLYPEKQNSNESRTNFKGQTRRADAIIENPPTDYGKF